MVRRGAVDEKQIVKNIRNLRLSKKVSLGKLASLTGLTKSYVSKIENSHKAPPFSTLIKIANGLNTDVSLLIAEDSEILKDINLCIVRKNERKEVISRGSLYGYHYEALAHRKVGKNMEPYIIEPAFKEKAVFSHEGEEFMYVLEGTHEFVYDGKKYILHEGDSIYFDSIIPHSGRNVGRKKAKILAVMYSYKRQ
jgi:transcriptional regulator with XRE-family HTH domain